jgi:hypothetical protein
MNKVLPCFLHHPFPGSVSLRVFFVHTTETPSEQFNVWHMFWPSIFIIEYNYTHQKTQLFVLSRWVFFLILFYLSTCLSVCPSIRDRDHYVAQNGLILVPQPPQQLGQYCSCTNSPLKCIIEWFLVHSQGSAAIIVNSRTFSSSQKESSVH